MDLEQEILEIKSKHAIQPIIAFVGDDKKKFDRLMSLYFSENIRLTQKASWVVNHVAENNLQLLNPYLKKLILNLENEITDAVKRNTIRLLQFIEIPEELQGTLINICFDFLQKRDSPVAVKAFSMTVLYNHCKAQPELANELKLVLEELLPYGSAGIKSRAKKILKKLDKHRPQ